MSFTAFAEREGNKRIFLWLGFGFFLVTYGGGPLGYVSGSVEHATSWGSTLLIQNAFFVGTAVGCLGLKALARQGSLKQGPLLGAVAYVIATLLCLVIQPVLAAVDVQNGVAVRSLLSLLVGIFYAQPLLFWFERFLEYSKTCGRFGFFAALVPCYLLNPLVMAVAPAFNGVPYVYSLAMVICAVISALVQTTAFRSSGQPARQGDKGSGSYRLTVYSASVLACLGFSWGISVSASLFVFGNGWPGESLFSLALAFGLLFVIALAMQALRSQSGVRFGAFIRLSLVACGAVLVAAPLLFEFTPSLLYPLCNFVMIVGEISLILFSIDICCKEGESLVNIYAVNYATFVGAICISGALFWLLHTMIGGQTAWWLTATLATWVVLLVIPFLPSRSSDAVVFTLGKLPENEGYETNISLQRERMAQRYALSAGEAEVLKYLLQGMNREQIATQMYLSPWTIKSRISAIYKKCGIHSYKELMQLVSNDEA